MAYGLWWFIAAEVKVIGFRTVWEKAALKWSCLLSSWTFYANVFCFYAVVHSKRGWESSLLCLDTAYPVFFPPVSDCLCPSGYAAYLQTIVLILSFVWQVLLLGCFLCACLLPLWWLCCTGTHLKLSGQWLNYFIMLYPLINYQLNKTTENFVSATSGCRAVPSSLRNRLAEVRAAPGGVLLN